MLLGTAYPLSHVFTQLRFLAVCAGHLELCPPGRGQNLKTTRARTARACGPVGVRVHARVCAHVDACVRLCLYMCVCVFVCVCVCICAHARACMCCMSPCDIRALSLPGVPGFLPVPGVLLVPGGLGGHWGLRHWGQRGPRRCCGGRGPGLWLWGCPPPDRTGARQRPCKAIQTRACAASMPVLPQLETGPSAGASPNRYHPPVRRRRPWCRVRASTRVVPAVWEHCYQGRYPV